MTSRIKSPGWGPGSDGWGAGGQWWRGGETSLAPFSLSVPTPVGERSHSPAACWALGETLRGSGRDVEARGPTGPAWGEASSSAGGPWVSHVPPSEQGTLCPATEFCGRAHTRFESWLRPSRAGISRRPSLGAPGCAPPPPTPPSCWTPGRPHSSPQGRRRWGPRCCGVLPGPFPLPELGPQGRRSGKGVSIKEQLIARQQGPFWGPVNLL